MLLHSYDELGAQIAHTRLVLFRFGREPRDSGLGKEVDARQRGRGEAIHNALVTS
jgi:hypothetical protein